MDNLVIIKINNKLELCEIINSKNTDKYISLIVCNTRQKIRRSNKYKLKKFIEYDKTIDLYCNCKYNTKFIIHCDYCDKSHHYNNLGYNSCRCNSKYSPYKYHGINIIFHYNSIKDCLLNNYKEYLRVYTNVYYYKYFTDFINNEIYGDFGQLHFPYFNMIEVLNYINNNYKKKNKQCSNGGLSASINKFIKMMKTYKLHLYNCKDTVEINNIIKFYMK